MFSQVVTKKEVTSALTNKCSRKEKEHIDDLAAVVGSPEELLANIVRGIEGKEENRAADDEGSGESTRGSVWIFVKNWYQQHQSIKITTDFFLPVFLKWMVCKCCSRINKVILCKHEFIYSTWKLSFHWPSNSLCVAVLLTNARCSGAHFKDKHTNHARGAGAALQWILQKGTKKWDERNSFTSTCDVYPVMWHFCFTATLTCCLLLQDDLNYKLSAKIKELEDDGAKLQRTVNIQRAQIEKQKASLNESSRNCEGLQLEVSALKKVWNDDLQLLSDNKLKNLTL